MYPMIDKAKTAKRLNEIMRAYGKIPADIQEFLGLTCVQTVYRWLEGVNIPSIDNLYALSQMFQVPMDALIVGNGIRYIDFGSGIYKQWRYLLVYFRCLAGAGIG